MKLSPQDVDVYFKLMWALQFFAKERLQLLPDVTTQEEYAACSVEDKLKIREPLFQQRELIDAFVSENPELLSEEELQIVRSWKQAIVGDFYIERLLKRYAVFIGEDNTVYGVVGLLDDFDELFHKSELPRFVKALLLPFRDKIIYDGLLLGYNIYFGGGVRGDLKEIYLSAKQQGLIVERLDESPRIAAKAKPSKPQKNWRSELDSLAEIAKKLRGGAGQPAVNSPAFSVIKAAIEFGQLAADDPNDVEKLWKCYEKIERNARKLETTLLRM